MKRNRDLMDGFAVQVHRPDAAAHERARFNRATQAYNANVIAIFDLERTRKLRRDFDKHLRLQLGKMTQETRHPAAGMVFGEPISSKNKWKTRIARRRKTVFSAREPIHDRIRVARIERVVYRRLERFVMSRHRSILQTFRHVKPAESVFVQNERRVTALTVEPTLLILRFVIGRLVFFKLGHIDPSPISRVPPDEFLALAPRFTARPRAGAIVNDASITRPAEAPSVTKVISGFP